MSNDLNILAPATVEVRRDAFNRLTARIDHDCSENVRPVSCFPDTRAGTYIALMSSDNKELGLIKDLSELDIESRSVIEEELALCYFQTVVTKINRVTSRFGVTTWDVETDRGHYIIQVRERGDIRRLANGRIVLTDAHYVKFVIENVHDLDAGSRYWIEAEV